MTSHLKLQPPALGGDNPDFPSFMLDGQEFSVTLTALLAILLQGALRGLVVAVTRSLVLVHLCHVLVARNTRRFSPFIGGR